MFILTDSNTTSIQKSLEKKTEINNLQMTCLCQQQLNKVHSSPADFCM